ncbi:dihydroorotase family protein [Flavobacterium sp.]|uniref:dihydroorotase n=1 Tax=Flavobacterium sp. TaxID=239 RepID=UPI0025BFD27F|nr:dihydroorotase [Flavobacterium sp.]
MRLLIKHATLIDKNNAFHNQKIDIEITNGVITAIEKDITPKEDNHVITKENLYVSKGWIDTSVVFGEPGYETTETIENGLKVAAKSGFTDVLVHSNTNPAIDNQSVIHLMQNKAQEKITQLHVVGCMTKNAEGVDLAELFDMKNAGAIAFGDYKKPTPNANLLKIALQYTQDFDATIFAFPMNKDIKGKGFVNEGIVSTKLGMKGIPALAEELDLERNLSLLAYTNGKMHVPMISTKKSVELLKEAKAKGLHITCGVSVNNLVLTDEELTNFNSNTRLMPPLRSETDRQALIEGILDGTIDVITSDHCPVNVENKRLEYDLADDGSIGLESIFGALQKVLPLEVIVEKLTHHLGLLKENPIRTGTKAKLTLFNPTTDWTFEPKNITSFSKNAIMLGKKMKGEVYGIINGEKSNL